MRNSDYWIVKNHRNLQWKVQEFRLIAIRVCANIETRFKNPLTQKKIEKRRARINKLNSWRGARLQPSVVRPFADQQNWAEERADERIQLPQSVVTESAKQQHYSQLLNVSSVTFSSLNVSDTLQLKCFFDQCHLHEQNWVLLSTFSASYRTFLFNSVWR